MAMGVMQNVSVITIQPIEWPPIVGQIGEFAGQFKLSLNFFKPECSAQMEFWKKWVGKNGILEKKGTLLRPSIFKAR
jgi:hypothetical protein